MTGGKGFLLLAMPTALAGDFFKYLSFHLVNSSDYRIFRIVIEKGNNPFKYKIYGMDKEMTAAHRGVKHLDIKYNLEKVFFELLDFINVTPFRLSGMFPLFPVFCLYLS